MSRLYMDNIVQSLELTEYSYSVTKMCVCP